MQHQAEYSTGLKNLLNGRRKTTKRKKTSDTQDMPML